MTHLTSTVAIGTNLIFRKLQKRLQPLSKLNLQLISHLDILLTENTHRNTKETD